jgi:hypothetical protein
VTYQRHGKVLADRSRLLEEGSGLSNSEDGEKDKEEAVHHLIFLVELERFLFIILLNVSSMRLETF